VGESGGLDLPARLVQQVRDRAEVPAALPDLGDQLGDRLEGVVTLNDDIDARVLDELIGVVGRRDAAEDRQCLGMHLLQGGRELDGAVALRHPVQIEPEDRRFEAAEQLLDVQIGMHEHQRRDVHDLRVEAVVGQPLLDREPADRVHLVDRGDVDAVAVAQVGEQHVVTLAEVVDAGRVQEEQVSLEPWRYLKVHRGGLLYLVVAGRDRRRYLVVAGETAAGALSCSAGISPTWTRSSVLAQ
jgi:hypothetical protein